MNKITVPVNVSNQRVDAVLSEYLEITRSNLKNRMNTLFVNGQTSRLSKKVSAGDCIECELDKEVEIRIDAEDIELDIIFEDQNVFVINKPAGMVVHPAAGNYSGTMAQGILYKLQNNETGFLDSDMRPGIVHRLDKDTSGIIIAAKNSETLAFLSEQFKRRETKKTYLAIINGVLPAKKGRIEGVIGRDKLNRKKMTWKTEHGKLAITEYRVMKEWKDKSFVALGLKTGRTHQLRVHMLSMNAPIIGDPVYARKTNGHSLMLHAYKLCIRLPGEDEVREFRAPLPERFKTMIKNLSDMD